MRRCSARSLPKTVRDRGPITRCRRGRVPNRSGRARECARVVGPEPVLPSLQAPRRRHAAAVPDSRKDRITGRKRRQETGERPLTIPHEPGGSPLSSPAARQKKESQHDFIQAVRPRRPPQTRPKGAASAYPGSPGDPEPVEHPDGDEPQRHGGERGRVTARRDRRRRERRSDRFRQEPGRSDHHAQRRQRANGPQQGSDHPRPGRCEADDQRQQRHRGLQHRFRHQRHHQRPDDRRRKCRFQLLRRRWDLETSGR